MKITIILLLLGQSGYRRASNGDEPQGRVREWIRVVDGSSYTPAFFEFFSADTTAGQTSACACTNPTGVGGEVLTFTRASAAYCTKGNETTGIVAGDLVECASGQPRVMPGGDGTGGLGLSVWEARTNGALRSEEIDNATWTKFGNISAAPTVTADYGTAPDNVVDADRVQYNATGSAISESVTYQAGCAVGTVSASAFIKGVSGSGNVDMIINRGAGNFACQTCSFVAGSWTRCKLEGAVVASSGNLVIGNEQSLAVCGQSNRPAADVLVWGTQCELGSTVSPPIKTEGTAQTRVAEVASFAGITLAGSTRSLSASWWSPSTFTAGRTALSVYVDANNDEKIYATSTAATSTVTSAFRIGGVSSTKATTAAMSASVSARLAGYYDGAARYACLDGTCLSTSGALTLPTGSATIYIGSALGVAGTEANTVVKKVRVDPGYSP